MSASIVLAAEDHPQAAMAASDGVAQVEDMQFSLGEGPGIDAYAAGQPVLVEDLAESNSRWIHYVPAALEMGVAAVFAFPLQVGAIRTGVLTLYSESPDPLGDAHLADFATLAGLVTEAVLAMQAGVMAEELASSLANAAEHRSVVHQATGMIAMQLECSAQDAFVRLRARAFAGGLGLNEVATQVVERRLRFER